MATRTVVIESNRELAYALEGESASTADTFPKDRWKTKVEPALEVEVGDQIRLEASMLNAVGAGDSVMEFIGETSKQYEGKSLVDSAASLRPCLAIATAKKNGSEEAIDLTDDSNNDPPQQSPNQASDSVAVKVKVEIKVEDESPPAVFLDRLANDAPPDLPAGAPAGPIGGELVPNLGVAVREAASAAGQTSPMEVDSGKKAKRGRPYGSTRKNKTDVAKLAAWERMIFVKPVSNDTARPTDYTTENMKIWAESMLDASPNKEETQKKKLQAAQEFLLFLQTHPSTENVRVSQVKGVRGSDGCDGTGFPLRSNPLAIFLNSEGIDEQQAFELTGMAPDSSRPHAVHHRDQAALILLWAMERRMKKPRAGSDTGRPNGAKIYACSSTMMAVARVFSFLFELEDRLVRNDVLPDGYPVVRRDLTINTGHFKSSGGIINNWYVQAVKEDPACCASRKATRVQEERLSHRVSSAEFKNKYSFNVDTMDIEGLLGRIYEWIASVTALRLEQAYQFDVRNMFESEPHTDMMIGPPGDQRPWMNDTDDSQVLMFFQTYGKNEGINITRGQ
jgi:hypothetical protein